MFFAVLERLCRKARTDPYTLHRPQAGAFSLFFVPLLPFELAAGGVRAAKSRHVDYSVSYHRLCPRVSVR